MQLSGSALALQAEGLQFDHQHHKIFSYSGFYSLQAFNGQGKDHPNWEGQFVLLSSITMLISTKNNLTYT
jgi:hypothetical protein